MSYLEYPIYLARRLPCVLFGWHRRFRHLGASCRGRDACGRRMREHAEYERWSRQ